MKLILFFKNIYDKFLIAFADFTVFKENIKSGKYQYRQCDQCGTKHLFDIVVTKDNFEIYCICDKCIEKNQSTPCLPNITPVL